ncbi:hypothetical protein F5Y06DRAFT_99704 [Hypoxylon sp. FL0890]|nr:hypothetical protein F5Y06DRAFT_99704 [Hypoxylon sp. FL0890]
MTEKHMRLRLVVRRDGLPEERLMWNVSLDNDPTISKLLEKLNETIPLEIDQRGLEDYAVELHDDDGTSFECLHFHLVRTILKPDDRVFIRALDRDDNRRRRISGRHQISSDGRRLIDGIPFGRRLLKAPSGRPPVTLPPRKRPRLAYNHEHSEDDSDNEEDAPMLLLTNGNPSAEAAVPSGVRVGVDFDDADAEDEEFDSVPDPDVGVDDESDDHDQESSESLSDEDLEDELQDLLRDNAGFEENGEHNAEAFDTRASNKGGHKISALRAAFPSAPTSICEKILESSDGNLKTAYSGLAEGFEPKLSESALLAWQTSKKQASLKSTNSRDIASTKATSSKHTEDTSRDDMHDDEDRSELSDGETGEQVSALVRLYDHRGLPPGSITTGKGLAQMAAISGSLPSKKINSEGENTSAGMHGSKASPENLFNEDDETSSTGTSSSSEAEGSGVEDDSDSDEDVSSDSSDISGDNEDEDSDHNNDDNGDDDDSDSEEHDSPGPRSDASANSDSQSEHSSQDSDESESGPEERSAKPNSLGSSLQLDANGCLDHNNSSTQVESSSEGSDDSNVSSSEESSDDESSEAESSSESESELVKTETSSNQTGAVKPLATQDSIDKLLQAQRPKVTLCVASETKPVPPGAGKESTKKRNARRRAARKARMQAMQVANPTHTSSVGEDVHSTSPVLDEKALFEAKRQELLNAIADGGVEVGPFSHLDSSRPSTAAKRKRDEQDGFDQQNKQVDTPSDTPASEEVQSSSSAQKRRRVDVGAGRRLLFGALGLRNPKTKDDENELRAKLMKDVRPHGNTRLQQESNGPDRTKGDSVEPAEEDPDAWRDKIKYRAVECCHEGVELSEPPFPFVQRWDPQQQGSWFQKKNKRGGQSKRAQRNEAHFYEDSRFSRKRKHDESTMWDEEGYDDTFNGIDDNATADVELDYDDPEDGQHHETNEPTNDASQFTDMDDLPSLPSDLSTLRILRPGEVQVGMVITWQQWSCSSATNWQPQISNVTGVVVRIDDDATGLEVCLAKRDRYLDRNEKKYDQNTGQRIYDRFEAPDLDEDEDEDEREDEGFRTIGFAEMQQPRILQQPLPVITNEGHREVDQPPDVGPGLETEPYAAPEDVKVDANPERSESNEPPKSDTSGIASSETSQSGQRQQSSDMSISDLSRTSSPSRQLHESISQVVSSVPHGQTVQAISSHGNIASHSPIDRPSQGVSGLGIPSAMQSSAPLFDSHEDDVVTGTPKVVRSTVPVLPSSASSAHSGRQPDHTLDMDVTEPDSFRIIDDGVSTAFDAEDQHDLESNEDMSTPTPTAIRQSESAVSQEEPIPRDVQPSSPANPSTPSSLSSINTVWCTALTSRNTQTPSQPQSQSQSLPAKVTQKARTLKDKEYEEAMRKLDDFSDDQESLSRVPDSFKRSSLVGGLDSSMENDIAIEPSSKSKSPQVKVSPPPTRKRKSPKSSSRFTIPPGSQVVELSSDSEPVYTEDYADDEVDGTYSPEPDSFPRGNGWVKKKMDVKNRNARSVTAPIKSQSTKRRQFLSSSQGPQSTLSTTSISQFSPIKPRRKTSSRF